MDKKNIFALGDDVEREAPKDVLGGSRIWESGLYPATLKCVYMDKFSGGSLFAALVWEISDGKGGTLKLTERETLISAKTNSCKYRDDKTGKLRPLPGYTKVSDICQMVLGMTLEEVGDMGEEGMEPKVHAVYDFDAGKEINKSLLTINDIHNAPMYVGLQQIISNKQTKVGADWVNTDETREENKVNKLFNENKQTLVEMLENAEPTFAEKWEKVNAGKVVNRVKKVAKQGLPAAGKPTKKLDLKPKN